MPFKAGTRLGSYTVSSLLGSGASGDVYLAQDDRLGRDVALKVLRNGESQDPVRLARFSREARLLASLNHRNVATLHGLEQSEETKFLVMELIDGETLREKIARGPLTFAETRSLFTEIAEGLEAAHERGIVHRDLKPSNIKISSEGVVKILDFGLAKSPRLLSHEAVETQTLLPEQKIAPTIAGTILGTAAYMAPEQARGMEVDKRADIWAFGCCLFEAVSGRRPFSGGDVASVLAAVLKDDPQYEELPPDTPSSIRRLIGRCLTKDPKMRLRDIGDARVELLREPGDATAESMAGGLPAEGRLRLWRRAALAVVPIALLSAIAWFAPVVPGRLAGDEIEPKPLRRFTVSLKPGAAMDSPYQRGIRVSDGAEALVVQSADGGFYRRRLEVLEPEWIEGTELGDAGFLSPGAEWLGFKDIGGNLKRVPLSGGRAETLCAAGVNGDAAWGPDGFIYFMDLLEPRGLALFRVREEGGDPQRIYPKDGPGIAGVAGYTSIVLSTEGSPKIRGILMAVHTGPGAANARVEALSLDSGRVTRLLDGATLPLYSPSGHLVYSSAEGLWAVAFDADAMELVGSPVELTEAGMRPSGRQEFRSWDLSAEGTLVYTPSGTRRRIVASSWNGEARELDFETPDEREALALSPDGGSLALSRAGSIWVHDVNRGTEVLLTADDAHYPLWSPDGRHLVFVSNRGVGQELRWIELGGTGASEFLFGSANNLMPTSFVDEGNELLFSEWGDQASSVWRVSLGSDEAPRPVLDSAFGERVAAVSPDGSLMAYTSTETGDAEIYVRRYPQLDRKVRVSSRGGFYPRWAPDGERLVFLAPDGIYSAKVASDSSLVSEPALLVESRSTADSMELAVLSDNTGFLYVEVQRPSEVVVVQNYSSHLRSVAPRWER